MKRELTCHCGETVEADFPEEVDISSMPETIEEILNGSFLSVTCGSCGELLKPEFSTHIYDSGGRLNLYYLPELERTRYLAGKVETDADRVAIGFPELREKILMFSRGLDDRAVEILKFMLLEKIEDPDQADITLVELSERDELVFHIEGIKEDEVGVSKVPMDLYNKIWNSLDERLQEEPFSSIAEGQYVSIHKISIEDEES
jgi:hypothetical protein